MSKKRHHNHQHDKNTNSHDQPASHEPVKWPSPYPVRIEPSAEDDKKYADDQQYKERQINIAKWLNWITAGAAAIALAGLVYLNGQLEITKRQLKLERPWVSTVGNDLAFDKVDFHLRGVGFKLQNGGRSPATHTQTRLAFAVGPAPGVVTQDTIPRNSSCDIVPDLKSGGNVVLPNAQPAVVQLLVPPEIVRQLDVIYTGTRGLYLIGCIYYTDSGGTEWHRTDITETLGPGHDQNALTISKWGNDAY